MVNDILTPAPTSADKMAANRLWILRLERGQRKREERVQEEKRPGEMRSELRRVLSWGKLLSRRTEAGSIIVGDKGTESSNILALQKPTARWPTLSPSPLSHSNWSLPATTPKHRAPSILLCPSFSCMNDTKDPQILRKGCNMKESCEELDPHPSQPEVRR